MISSDGQGKRQKCQHGKNRPGTGLQNRQTDRTDRLTLPSSARAFTEL